MRQNKKRKKGKLNTKEKEACMTNIKTMNNEKEDFVTTSLVHGSCEFPSISCHSLSLTLHASPIHNLLQFGPFLEQTSIKIRTNKRKAYNNI